MIPTAVSFEAIFKGVVSITYLNSPICLEVMKTGPGSAVARSLLLDRCSISEMKMCGMWTGFQCVVYTVPSPMTWPRMRRKQAKERPTEAMDMSKHYSEDVIERWTRFIRMRM